MDYTIHAADPCIAERVDPYFEQMAAALKDADKLSRMGKVEELKAQVKENEFSDEERAAWGSDIAAALKSSREACYAQDDHRDRRACRWTCSEEIRPLHIVPGYLPRVHGCGLFQRGQTQVMSVHARHAQRVAASRHYRSRRGQALYAPVQLPPYCTGETGRMGAPKRREIGHGALAEARFARAPHRG